MRALRISRRIGLSCLTPDSNSCFSQTTDTSIRASGYSKPSSFAGFFIETSSERNFVHAQLELPYQPVDEVLNWSSTHNMSGPNLRRATLCSGLIAEQRLRQRADRGRVHPPSSREM